MAICLDPFCLEKHCMSCHDHWPCVKHPYQAEINVDLLTALADLGVTSSVQLPIQLMSGSWSTQVPDTFYTIEDNYGLIISRHASFAEAMRDYIKMGRPVERFIVDGRLNKRIVTR